MRNELESTRSFALTLAHRAVQDIRHDGFRQLRNYVDMCAILAKRDSQKRFFDYAQKLLERTESLYYTLVHRLLAEVDEDIICNVGINLGVDSIIYGASRIRKEGRHDVSWCNVAIADAPGLDEAITAAEKASSYTWALYLSRPLTEQTVRIMRSHPFSAFFIIADPVMFTPEAAALLGSCVNAVELLFLHEPEITPEACDAVRTLRERKMFFGFLVELDEENGGQALQPDWLDVLAQYSLFCIYSRKPNMTEETSQTLHTEIVRSREEVVQVPIFLLDWEMDLRQVSDLLTPDAAVGRCLPEGEVFPLHID